MYETTKIDKPFEYDEQPQMNTCKGDELNNIDELPQNGEHTNIGESPKISELPQSGESLTFGELVSQHYGEIGSQKTWWSK